MRLYTIFDDFGSEAIRIIEEAGMELTVHPKGVPRPDSVQMKAILEEYDGVIIGTSQKIAENMFERIDTPRIIGTASVGVDHIRIPEEKKGLITVVNTPKANAQSVAEYTIGCALSCVKRLAEGCSLYKTGKDNKALHQKPEDLNGKTIGVVGAGNISVRIMEYAQFFGMRVLCWTKNPENHKELTERGIQFYSLDELVSKADVISVNLPNNDGTRGIMSKELIDAMKLNAIFISVSRKATVDVDALFEKARKHAGFYVCLDLDVDSDVIEILPGLPNVMVTPHIAGGTVETRKRMFREVAEKISEIVRNGDD
jgi:D-3-phosphoglycerate dehydrogenase